MYFLYEGELREMLSYLSSVQCHHDIVPHFAGPDDRPERGERAVVNPPREGRVDGSQGKENLAGPAKIP